MDPSSLLAIAAKIIASTGIKEELAKIDARPVPELIRSFQVHQLLEAVFPAIWEGLVQHDKLSEQEAVELRKGLFAALYLVARSMSPTRSQELEWVRFGAQQPNDSPASVSEKALGYVLVYDPSRQTAVYVSGSSRTSFGQTWEWRDEGWRARPVVEHAIPQPHTQGFAGFHDVSRDAIACWTLVPHQVGDSERYQPLGLLLQGDRIEIIDAGEPPIVPSQMLFAFGAIFGVDPATGETIMLARDALYALRDNRWLHLCALEPQATSREWWAGTRAAFAHQGELYFTWTDCDNFSRRTRLARFTGAGVQEVRAAGQPCDDWDAWMSDGEGARFVHKGASWRLSGASAELRWESVEETASLLRTRNAWAARLATGEVLIGPGEIVEERGESRYQRCFLHVFGGRLRRLGEALEGVGVCPADRTLLGHGDQVLAVYRDGRVERVRGTLVEQVSVRLPDTALVLAGVCLDSAGCVMAVAADGAVWRLGADGWQRVGEPNSGIARWTIRCCAWDPPRSRMVAWGYEGDKESRLAERTAVWASGGWSPLEAGSVLPVGERFLRGDLDHQLIFDTHHQEIVLVGAISICVLSSDRWHATKPEANIYRGADAGSNLLVHDEESATTLLLDTKDGWCGRIDGGSLVRAGRLMRPPERLATYAGDAQSRRAAMVYIPASRSVVIYASGASYDELWELPLARVFTESPPPGERQGFPKAARDALRFSGHKLRRIVEAATEAADPSGAALVRFRRFGEEPPVDWSLPPQARGDLMMVFDGRRQELIFVRVTPADIVCWRRGDQGWQELHRSENRASWSTAMRLSSDPHRGAVLWCVSEEHGAYGYRITDQQLEPIATGGDGPIRSDKYEHRDKVVFAWDPDATRLLMASTEGLWGLGEDDLWSRIARWDDATPLHQVDSFQQRDGGAWDPISGRLVLWKLRCVDGLRCWAVSAAGITRIQEAGFAETGGCVLSSSERGLQLYDGAARVLYRLEASGWVRLETGSDAPALDVISDAVMVGHGDSVDILSARPYQLHTHEHGTWRVQGQPTSVERPRVAKWLGRHHGRLLATDSFRLWLLEEDRWSALPSVMESLLDVAWRHEHMMRTAVTCVSNDDGPARVLCESGVIAELSEQGWALLRPQGDLPVRDGYYASLSAYCATDASWLVVLRRSEDAVTFRGTRDGGWTEVCRLPFGAGLESSTSRQLVFDARLGCFVLAGSDGVLHLRGDAWQRASIHATPEPDKLVHDVVTGATLLLRGTKVYLLGEAICTELRGAIAPPLATRQRAIRDLPPAAEYLDDSSGRRLLWLDGDDAWGNYELDLSSFFEQARALAR